MKILSHFLLLLLSGSAFVFAALGQFDAKTLEHVMEQESMEWLFMRHYHCYACMNVCPGGLESKAFRERQGQLGNYWLEVVDAYKEAVVWGPLINRFQNL